MRLAVNILSGGRYYREGDEVDEKLIPPNLRQINDAYAQRFAPNAPRQTASKANRAAPSLRRGRKPSQPSRTSDGSGAVSPSAASRSKT